MAERARDTRFSFSVAREIPLLNFLSAKEFSMVTPPTYKCGIGHYVLTIHHVDRIEFR